MPRILYDKDEFVVRLNQGQQQLLRLIATKSKPDVSAQAKDTLLGILHEQIAKQQRESSAQRIAIDDELTEKKKPSSAIAYKFISFEN